MKKRRIWFILIMALFLFVVWVIYLSPNSEHGRVRQGNEIIKKIEHYRKANNRLPSSLTDVGIIVKDETHPPIYYQKQDSTNYIIWFGTSLGESITYHSDTKKWDDF